MMNEKAVSRLIIIFAVLYAIGMLIYFPKWIVDDAYITFRYAENLSRHSQLVYNYCGKPVEGYTGILLPIIISSFMRIGLTPDAATQIIGIVFFMLGGIYLFRLLNLIRISRSASAFALLLYFVAPAIYTHVFSGLETILFSSSIPVVIFYSMSLLKNKSTGKTVAAYSLILLITSLIRPEGIVLSFLMLFFNLFYIYSEKKDEWKNIFAYSVLFFVLPFIVYFNLRWNYYGQFFPNTYYLKTGSSAFNEKSFQSFVSFFDVYLILPFLGALLLLLIDIDKIWSETKKNNNKTINKELLSVMLPAVLFTCIVLIKYFYTNLLMNYSYRFYFPTYTLFILLLAILINFGFQNLKELKQSKPFTAGAYSIIILMIFLVHFGILIQELKKEFVFTRRYQMLINEVHIPAGKFINQNFSKNSSLIVLNDAGAIPYYSKLNTTDFGGLNDDYLSHQGKLNERNITDYFYHLDAEVLAITSSDKNQLKGGGQLEAIISDARFGKYKLIKVFGTPVLNYYEFIYAKREY